jgi:hypothetical protein
LQRESLNAFETSLIHIQDMAAFVDGRFARIGFDGHLEIDDLRSRCVMTTFDPDTLEQLRPPYDCPAAAPFTPGAPRRPTR